MRLLETATAVDGERDGTRRRPTGGPAPARFSRPHWIALIAGVLAALTAMAALRDRRETVLVAVADTSIAAGSPVAEDDVRWAEVPADSSVVAGLVDESVLREPGLVAARPITEGEPIVGQAVTTGAEGFGVRSISVPVAREHAVGGQLRPGDRVDVVDVVTGRATYAVTDAEVLAVGTESAGDVGTRPGQFNVTIAVDAESALRVSAALADDRVEIVRSTGAPAADRQATAGVSNGPGGEPGEVSGG